MSIYRRMYKEAVVLYRMGYCSPIKRNTFDSFLMGRMNLEPIIDRVK